MTERCVFSKGARAQLERLGFFSVGDEDEMFLDHAIPPSSLGDAAVEGISWFYAYPRCHEEELSYMNLPNLLKNHVKPEAKLEKNQNEYTFHRIGYLTDLVVLSFEGHQIAFFRERP